MVAARAGRDVGSPGGVFAVRAARRIAAATVDLKAIKSPIVNKLCTRLYSKKKTKKALAEKLLCDAGPGAVATVTVKAVFNTEVLKVKERNDLLANQLRLILEGQVQVRYSHHLSTTKKSPRVATLEVLLERDHPLKAGQTLSSSVTPSYFTEYRGKAYRKYD